MKIRYTAVRPMSTSSTSNEHVTVSLLSSVLDLISVLCFNYISFFIYSFQIYSNMNHFFPIFYLKMFILVGI